MEVELHRYEAKILNALKQNPGANLETIEKVTGLGKDAIMWALQLLKEKGLVEIKEKKAKIARLSEEGKAYAISMLPEEKLMQRLAKGILPVSELKGREDQIGIQWLKAKGLAAIQNGMLVLVSAPEGELSTGKVLRELAKNPSEFEKLLQTNEKEIAELKSRHLLEIEEKHSIESVELSEKGREIANQQIEKGKEITQLTKELIQSKAWRSMHFSKYNIAAEVEPAKPARMHLLRRTINELRKAYLSLGFEEIRGPIIEPAFWVFDYLFVPQDHPAREMQDTFFTSLPASMPLKETRLLSQVKEAHEKNWHAEWNKELASQPLLRTHTTNVTGRYIYKVVKALNEDPLAYSLPLKFFTIGRVFRNENLDYKHLADFYQTDGIVIGENLTMAMLFDTLLNIYKTIGIEVRFKPSYFPFVEPGVEVDMRFGDEWLEMGGAGIIRREIIGSTKKKINVLAWGLGVERVVLAKDRSIGSIVSLYNSSIGWLREKSV